MLWSKSFIPTLREAPQEAESIAHRLMLRAGLARMLVAGVYSYLPLGLRVLNNIKNIRGILSGRFTSVRGNLEKQMQEAGKTVEFYTYPGDYHNISSYFNSAMQRSVEFFNRYLKEK